VQVQLDENSMQRSFFRSSLYTFNNCWDCGSESRQGHRCLTLVSVVCCQATTRPEESYRAWCVCDRAASIMRRPLSTMGCCTMERKVQMFTNAIRPLHPTSRNVIFFTLAVTSSPTHSLWNVRCSLRMTPFKVDK